MKHARVYGRAFPGLIALLLLISCANPGVPLPPELELPRRVGDLHATRKGDKVTLTWSVPNETVDHQSIRHLGPTRICRTFDPKDTDCRTIAEISAQSVLPTTKAKKGQPAPKVQETYTDTLPAAIQQEHPTDLLTYAVSVLNTSGRTAGLSNTVQVPAAPALPPPTGLQAQVRSDGIALHWSNPGAPNLEGVHFTVRIYRRLEGAKAGVIAGDVALSGSEGEWLDQAFEWEKKYQYHVAVLTTANRPGSVDLQVEGADSSPVQVLAHDVFPPAVPSGLQAVASGAGQKPFIDLIWAPVPDADLAGYNVYRHEEGEGPVKVNSDLVKTPAYRDADVRSGHQYTYSVSAVDLRGNESAHSEEASEKMP